MSQPLLASLYFQYTHYSSCSYNHTSWKLSDDQLPQFIVDEDDKAETQSHTPPFSPVESQVEKIDYGGLQTRNEYVTLFYIRHLQMSQTM